MNPYTLDPRSLLAITDDQFYQLCCNNPEVKFERNPEGVLIIMPPTGGETGNRNIEIAGDFVLWNRQFKLGKLFDSSTCFRLPRGGDRSPDLVWIENDRWNQLSASEKEKFPPIAPDFVLELMSPSDVLSDVQQKMVEYMASGVRLGWLIDRSTRHVEIYRQGQTVQVLQNPAVLLGERVLPGFTLDMQVVW
jgi:Uma2 family endonuclease